MNRILTAWRCQIQEYIWWYLGLVFMVILFVSCGLSHAFGMAEIKAAFAPLSAWVILRGLFREAWCFGLVFVCSIHMLGAPLCLVVLLSRAYTIGFAWGWWLSCLGFGGFFSFLFLLLPQGLVVLVCLTGASCVGLSHAFHHRRLDRRSFTVTTIFWSLPAFAALLCEWLAIALVL